MSLVTGAADTKAAPPAANRVGLAPIQFEGSAGRAWKGGLREAVVRGLVQGELDVVSPETATPSNAETCTPKDCAIEAAIALEARYAISTRVVYRDKTYAFSLDAYDSQTGDLVASSSDRCALCGSAEAAELLTKQAAGIRAKLERLAVGPAQFDLTTTPSGAMVRVDGKLVGETPLSIDLIPGEHRVEFTLEGYVAASRTLDAVRGVREGLNEELAPAPAARSAPPSDAERALAPARPLKIAGGAALGVGAASLAAGAAFLILDGKPREGRCSGADVDSFGSCRQVYTSLPHGIALAVVGVGLIGTGVGLIVAGVRRDARNTKATRAGATRAGVQWFGGGVRGWF